MNVGPYCQVISDSNVYFWHYGLFVDIRRFSWRTVVKPD